MRKIIIPIIFISVIAVSLIGIAWYALSLKSANIFLETPKTQDGFLPPLETGEENSLIRVDAPLRNDVIKSPVVITGSARGFWFFEASFPIVLLDDKGDIIGRAIAEAQDEWMTEEFVPFRSILAFDPKEASEGTLVLEKDNPSGLPENADAISLPVRFEKVTEKRAFNGCIITGCSMELCSDTETVTPCIYRESFACYVNAICERGSDGICGWRATPELTQCIKNQNF